MIISDTNSEAATPDFYEVAEQFLAESAGSDTPHKTLRKWALNYPQFASDLASVAFANSVMRAGAVSPTTDQDLTDVVESAKRVVSASEARMSGINSLVGAARVAGFTPQQLAKTLRIDVLILAKLEQRLLDVSTIPFRLLASLASEVQRSVEEITAYLSLPPQLATNAQYKSKKRPSIEQVKKQAFGEALMASNTLSLDDKRFWLDQLESGG